MCCGTPQLSPGTPGKSARAERSSPPKSATTSYPSHDHNPPSQKPILKIQITHCILPPMTEPHILHDWDLAQKKMLLKKSYDALPSGGAVIVYDAIINDARSIKQPLSGPTP